MLVFCMAFLAGCGGSDEGQTGEGEKLIQIKASHQPNIETFPIYKAIQEGLDKELGAKVELVFFDSGMPQIEALPARQWQVGGIGCVPALLAALRYDAYIIGVCDDESLAHGVIARPDNPVFQTKGYNPKYPDAYGTPEDIAGKEFLATTVSSGHFQMSSFLNALGKKDSDVVIKNLEQAQAIAAFEAGEGDFLSLWSPFLYTATDKGWKVVADGSQVGAKFFSVMIADKKVADEHPEVIVKYLDAYLQMVDEIRTGTDLSSEYKAFLNDWGAMDISLENAKRDFETHPMFTLKEQLDMFENGEVEESMAQVCDFFTKQGRFTPEEQKQLIDKGFGINDKFIKMLAKEKGLIN
ncbi:MAG TPA: nitrate ABC transporter substrate-binding protein [Clostridia bacterium]|nr:nitrate ABC transporter substrate-binding protein [Clostridia bacterium]